MDLRDPVIEFIINNIVVISLALLAAIIAIAPLIISKRQNKKELIYEAISILSVELNSDGTFLYMPNGRGRYSVIEIKVINTGRATIRPEDYDGPLTCTFGKGSTVVDAEIVFDSIPSMMEVKPEKVDVPGILLNRDSSFLIHALVQGKKSINISARIDGINEILELIRIPQRERRQELKMGLLFIIPISLATSALYFMPSIVPKHSQDEVFLALTRGPFSFLYYLTLMFCFIFMFTTCLFRYFKKTRKVSHRKAAAQRAKQVNYRKRKSRTI